ncbi:MAG: glutathione-disulfide reductase [Bdellovibrionaceae bacterium]|nr:glutathione-disulfide reductase [Pseudobdellovibrionaceae bacterium]
MVQYDYDLFVIGGGSGGIRSARWASQLGAKVALCEKDRLGGTCVIRGCIPKKLMVYGASFKKDFEYAKDYGWNLDSINLDWEKFNSVRNKEINRLESIYSNILKKNNVDYISGHGSLKDSHTVEVEGKKYSAKYILIAVGGWPSELSIKGAEHCITSNEIFNLDKQPQSLLLVGAGYISLEFASIFNSLGTNVSIMFRKNLILSGFDIDIRKRLQNELALQGIQILSNRTPVSIEKQEQKLILKDDKKQVWEGDLILTAVGRKANIKGLNLSSAKIQTEQDQIIVNNKFQTSCPNIYAVGDCINQAYQLTPVALHQGMFVSEYLFNKSNDKKFSYDNVPSAIFTKPETAVVGLSEEQAIEKGYKVKVYESSFRPLKLTLTQSKQKTYMKWVVCKKTDTLLGCHIIDENAGEILQGFAVAVKNKLKKFEIDQTIGIHPTCAEELVTMRTTRD